MFTRKLLPALAWKLGNLLSIIVPRRKPRHAGGSLTEPQPAKWLSLGAFAVCFGGKANERLKGANMNKPLFIYFFGGGSFGESQRETKGRPKQTNHSFGFWRPPGALEKPAKGHPGHRILQVQGDARAEAGLRQPLRDDPVDFLAIGRWIGERQK